VVGAEGRTDLLVHRLAIDRPCVVVANTASVLDDESCG
jgi:hypothetical protein